ncbi:MAG: hypothetical protein SFZ23_06605 [Planctomycetota bacterium]|nr:hypothetical protein [Planctomycetota bacterium]
MKSCMILGLVTVVCGSTFAQNIAYTFREISPGYRMVEPLDKGMLTSRLADQSYDNWRGPSDGGVTNLALGRQRVGGDEYGDDVQLANWNPSSVSNVGWTFANMSTQRFTALGVAIRFYNQNSMLVGEDSAVYFGSVPPGTRATVSGPAGYLIPFNIPTTENMTISVEFFRADGIDIADMGMLYGGPISAGASSDFIRNLTTGQQIDLGPGNNLGFFIDTVIPAPSTGVLVLGGVMIARRRRRG